MSYILKGKLESVKYDSTGKIAEIKIVPCGEYTLRKDDKKYCVLMQADSKKTTAIDAKLLEYENAVTISITGKCGCSCCRRLLIVAFVLKSADLCPLADLCRRLLIVASGIGKTVLLSFKDEDPTGKDEKISIEIKSRSGENEQKIVFSNIESIEIFA